MTASRVPVLGITMGDPAGVGPEITAKALARPEVTASCKPLVIGDRSVIEATLTLLRSRLQLHAVSSVDACRFEPGRLECLDLANVDVATLPKSTVSAEAGRAAADWAQRLAAGERFDPAAERLVDVAHVLDRIYGR